MLWPMTPQEREENPDGPDESRDAGAPAAEDVALDQLQHVRRVRCLKPSGRNKLRDPVARSGGDPCLGFCLYIYSHTYTYTYTHTYMYTYKYVYIYVYKYICTCTKMYI